MSHPQALIQFPLAKLQDEAFDQKLFNYLQIYWHTKQSQQEFEGIASDANP